MSLDTSGLDRLVVDHLRTMLDPSKGGGLLSSTRTIRESVTHDFSQYRLFTPPDTERVAAFTGAPDEAELVDPKELLDAVPAFAAPFESAVLLGVVQHVPDRVSLYGKYTNVWGTVYINRNTDPRYSAWADAPLARQMHRGFTDGLAPALLALYVELGAPSDFITQATKMVTEAVDMVTPGSTATTDVIDSEDIPYLGDPATWHAVAPTVVATMRTRLGASASTPSSGPKEPRVPVPLVYPFRNFRAGSLNFGIQLVYRQSWTPLGTQAGEIIRTLPLGPRQSERVTVEAVTRSKQTQTTELSTSMQTTTEASSTTTDSSEVVREASEKFNWHAEVSAGANFGFGSAQLSAGMGGENASSSRSTKNRLNEAMEKTSSQLRQDTKIVVSTEAESSRSTSSVSEISNPNDEVAVTYIYSRLQRQYELHTYLASIATCVFYAEELPAPGDLTASWIRRHDWILAKALLDPSFRSDLETVLAHEDNAAGAEETDPRITKLMDTLTPGLPDPSGVSGTIPDLYASPQAAYERELERRRARQSQQRRYERSLARLQRHLYSNILHYMRAIWSQEDADSRLMRYSSVRVPIRWMFNTTQGGSMLTGEWVPDVRDEARDTAPLSEIIDPSGPIGYAGNYAVFALNGGLTYPGLEAALTDLRLPFLRHIGTGHVAQDSSVEVSVRASTNRRGPGSYDFKWNDTVGAWVDSSNPTRMFAPSGGAFNVDALQIVLDGKDGPVTPKAGWTLHVEVEVIPVLEDPELRSLRYASPAPPAGSEGEVYDAEVLAEHTEYFSDVAAAFARLPERPTRWDELDAETQGVVRARWPQYQLRQRHTRRVLLDTNNVVLSRVVDPASSLEPLKAIHRYVDVVQAFEEAGQRRLENQRRQARLDNQMLGDPDIERVALVAGDASAVIDADGQTDLDAAVAACFQRLRKVEPLLAEREWPLAVVQGSGSVREPSPSMWDASLEKLLRIESSIAAVYQVSTFREAQERHADDRRLLRDLLGETARMMGHLTVERMRAAGPTITGGILGDPTLFETETSSSGPLDRFSRALAAWLVHTSELPYPAFAEDPPPMLNPGNGTSELGPPPMPTPVGGLPGGTPGPSAPGQPWRSAGLGTYEWKNYDSDGYPGIPWALAALGTDDRRQVRLRLLAPEAGGFPILTVVRHFRDPLQVNEMLRLDQGERRNKVAALVGEIDRFLSESVNATVRALTGNGEPDWRTLRPLLEAARATWIEPTDRDLWRAAGNEIDALIPWTLEDYASAGFMVLSLALLLAGPLGITARVGTAAVRAVGLALEVADLSLSLSMLLARRDASGVINRFAEIDAALEVAESVDKIDGDIALTVVTSLLPDLVTEAAPVVTRAVRQSARAATSAFTQFGEFRVRLPRWMEEAAQATPPPRGQPVPPSMPETPPRVESSATLDRPVGAAAPRAPKASPG